MRYRYIVLIAAALLAIVALRAVRGHEVPGDRTDPAGRLPNIRPDYRGITVPANIAPLNFLVDEPGTDYYVKVHSKEGRPIEVAGRSAKIAIPEGPWHRLLEANRGQELYVDVFVKTAQKQWERFERVVNEIAREDIDGYLVYRRIHPAHNAWGKMGIYSRNLHDFDESLVLDNGYFEDGCLNCHTFWNNRTDRMLIGIRSAKYGSSALLVHDGAVEKIGTKFGYTAWHPSGRVAAYSINNVVQFSHSAESEIRDVLDLDSLMAYYIVESKAVKTSPNLARKDRLETYPAWSPDGRYLYFCSGPIWWTANNVVPDRYREIKCDLVRISYDVDSDKWGELETVLAAKDTGRSILLPRVSPDGRWLLYCMCDYGCFPVYQASSDLYITDLKTAGETGRYIYRRLDVNSDKSESWHCWSSNSRWIVFSSKRSNGIFTRVYLSYVDETGRAHKPILLPQKDPTFYDSCFWTYSLPELVVGPIAVTGERLGRVVRGSQTIPAGMPITIATPKAGGLAGHEEPWRSGRQ